MNAPKLRFKDFKENWETYPFYECASINSKLVDPNQEQFLNLPHIGPGNIAKHTGQLLNYNLVKDENLVSGKFFFNETDVVYGKINPQMGKVVYPEFEGLCSADAYPISSKKEKIIPYYLFQVLLHSRFLKFSISVSMRTGMPKINRDELGYFIFNIPSIKEQQKIVDFFTLLNQRILKQQEKVELLKVQKKGFLQRVLSQGFRFKDEDGENYPEWKTVILKDISESVSYGMNAAAKEFDGENFYLRITDIDDLSRKFIEQGKVSPNGLLEEKYKLKKDDILFARTGASTGKSFFFEDVRSFYFAGFLIRVRLKDGVNANFVYQNTLTTDYRKWVKIMSMRSGQPGINGEEYGQFSFKLPCLEEQQKIAKLLSTIDNKIQFESNQISQLSKQKKGFMQQMFI